jgi:hypothetical protein
VLPPPTVRPPSTDAPGVPFLPNTAMPT